MLFVALLRTFDRGGRGDIVLVGVAAALLFVSAPVGPTLLLFFLAATLVIWARGARDGDRWEREGRSGRASLRRGRPARRGFARAGLSALLLAIALLLLAFSAFGAVPGNLASGPAEWLGAWITSITGPGNAPAGRDGLFALSLLAALRNRWR